MDYLCAKFDDFSFSRFGFIVRTADRQTESQGRINAIYSRDYRGVSNYEHLICYSWPIVNLLWTVNDRLQRRE